MKKIFIVSITIFLMLNLISCSSKIYKEGQIKSSYNSVMIGNAHSSNDPFIMVANGLFIRKIDNNVVSTVKDLMSKNAVDAVVVKSGIHSITAHNQIDIDIGNVNYKKGHEYLVDYLQVNGRVYFWVKDLTVNKVVYGKEVTEETL